MKKYIRFLAAPLCALILLPGCYTKRPYAPIISEPDYNSRVQVNGASYVKKKNAIGISVNIGVIGAGAYGGYALAPFKYQDGAEQKPVHALNAAAGALVGAGVVLLSDWIMGNNTQYAVMGNPQDWVQKVNKDYKFLSGKNSDFTMINPMIESRFQVKNIGDVEDFKKGFPNSNYAERIVDLGIRNFSYSKLPELLSNYPSSPLAPRIKERYLELASTVEECIDAAKRYPELQAAAETKALAKVIDVPSARTFSSYFSKEKNENVMFQQCLASNISSYKDIVETFPTHPEANKLRSKILSKINSVEEISNFMKKHPNFDKKSISERISTKGILKTLEDFKIIKTLLNEQSNLFIVNALKQSDVPAYKYPDIIREFTALDNSTVRQIYAMYTSAKRQEFSKCVSAKSSGQMNLFIKNYAVNSPYEPTDDLNTQAKNLYEYWYCIEWGIISDFAEYAKKHPDKFEEMDNLAYKRVSITDKGSIDNYVRYFPNGKYVSIVKDKIPEARAYEQKKEYERMNELCHTCHGNGNCSKCNGRGESKCISCNGKGYRTGWGDEIEACGCGNGYASCTNCRGSGRCTSCRGSGFQNR